MTRRHGRNSRLYVDLSADGAGSAEPVAFLTQWNLDFSADRIDVTAFGDTNKVSVQGLPGSQGAFSGWYDDATAQLFNAAVDTSGVARTFYAYPDRANNEEEYFFGTAHFDFSVSTGVADAVAVSGSFEAASEVSKVTS
jgi:hypothetical protein